FFFFDSTLSLTLVLKCCTSMLLSLLHSLSVFLSFHLCLCRQINTHTQAHTHTHTHTHAHTHTYTHTRREKHTHTHTSSLCFIHMGLCGQQSSSQPDRDK